MWHIPHLLDGLVKRMPSDTKTALFCWMLTEGGKGRFCVDSNRKPVDFRYTCDLKRKKNKKTGEGERSCR